jgi:hydroxymethylglutaryl-CoA reductase (NADPH)
MSEQSGLKNRGRTRADVDERRRAAEQLTGSDLSAVADFHYDPEIASKNIENMIGVTQIPLGYAGPVLINGGFAKGAFLVPMATTEGALTASVSRGMSVITSSGGANVLIFDDVMTRAPVFRTEGIQHTARIIKWISENTDSIDAAASSTTSHGHLLEIEPFPNGRSLYLRLSFSTGDAMGMNMVTIASEAICKLIEENTGAELVSVSGNMCTDKKPAAINIIRGRGKCVVAETNIPESVVRDRLHCSVEDMVEINIRKNLVGSAMAGSLGFNAHAANMASAVFLATGQDPAQVVEASLCITSCEKTKDGLYMSVRLPVEVGTVGGGTRLPSQQAALSMLDCVGDGKAVKLAEIVAVTVLAGEMSVLGAEAAGQLGKAHKELGR